MKKENEEDDKGEEEKSKKYVRLQTSSICCIYLNLVCSTVYLITSPTLITAHVVSLYR